MRCINPRFIYLLTYLLIYLLHGVFEDLIVGGVELNQVVWERKAPVGFSWQKSGGEVPPPRS